MDPFVHLTPADARRVPWRNGRGVTEEVAIGPAGATMFWGYAYLSGLPIAPDRAADMMSYCDPAWISDYNWTRVMTYRQGSGFAASPAAAGEGLKSAAQSPCWVQ